MLKCNNLEFTYPDGPSFSFPEIACGETDHLLLLGESGTGKTTLLHLLAGLLSPTNGSVDITGTDIAKLSQKELDKFRGQHIGIVFQTPHFIESLNVMDNLIMPQFLTGNKIEKGKALEILTRLNLAHKSNQMTKNLSIGEQQRVAIARALVNNPNLILADEPTSALDDKNAFEVIELLEEQAALSGAALVIVTHDKRLKDKFSKRVEL